MFWQRIQYFSRETYFSINWQEILIWLVVGGGGGGGEGEGGRVSVRAWTNVSNGTSTLQGEHLCKIIFKSMHICRSYAPEKLILWPSSVTLTFNLPKKMFQMALLLPKDNKCVKYIWNSCINVGVMTRTNPDVRTHPCTMLAHTA